MGRFDGQVVMITGCATGIGSATACRFAKEGACIVGIDILAEPLRRTLADCESLGVKTLCIVRDVREPEGARKAVEQALHMFGHLDVLVCSAGIYTGSPLVDVVPRPPIFPLLANRPFHSSPALCSALCQ